MWAQEPTELLPPQLCSARLVGLWASDFVSGLQFPPLTKPGHQGHQCPEEKGSDKAVHVKRVAPCPGCGVRNMHVTFTMIISIAQNRMDGLTAKGLFPEKQLPFIAHLLCAIVHLTSLLLTTT